MTVVGVIPARYASTRFPGKALVPILGKPMVQWVVERASRARGVNRVLVATDDEKIASCVRDFGGEAVMTPSDCPTGSDRVWRAVEALDCDVVVNLQGDEPCLSPRGVEALVAMMEEDPGLDAGTLAAPIEDEQSYADPNVVKVVMDGEGRCLYFSRSPVPYLREGSTKEAELWRHVGIYAFRKAFLKTFTRWPQGRLERMEKLEQLRILEHGVTIRAARVDWPGRGVDVPGDVAAVEAYLREESRTGRSE